MYIIQIYIYAIIQHIDSYWLLCHSPVQYQSKKGPTACHRAWNLTQTTCGRQTDRGSLVLERQETIGFFPCFRWGFPMVSMGPSSPLLFTSKSGSRETNP